MKFIPLRFGRSRSRGDRARSPRARPNRLGAYYLLHMLGAAFPLAAGYWLYGWRAMQVVGLVMAATAAGMLVWRRVSARGATLHWGHAMWLALLLGLMLPPHLLLENGPSTAEPTAWAIVPAAGLLLAVLLWAEGGQGASRLHPLLLTYLLLAVFSDASLMPHRVLHRSRMFTGDLANLPMPGTQTATPEQPWISLSAKSSHDAMYVDKPASQRLTQYTRDWPRQRAPMAMEAMLRDHMPPLENLVVGGHPGPIGAGSAIAVIVGGLFLLYRGLIDYRVPLIIVLVAFAGFAALPTLLMPGAHVDWASGITFASYQIMASPLLLMAFFIAGSRSICPAGAKATTVFAMVVGTLAVLAQLYVSAAYGAYVAIAFAAILGPWIGERFAPDATERDR